MAHGLADTEMKKEHFDSQHDLDEKLDKLAKWIKESKHFIVFTGMFCK
jgi:predicted transcriptional regulator